MMDEQMINAMELLYNGNRVRWGSSGIIGKAIEMAEIAAEILDILKTNSPLRVTEIQKKSTILDDYPCQKISAIVRTLVDAGAIKRIKDPNEKEFIQFDDDGFGRMVQVVRFTLAE